MKFFLLSLSLLSTGAFASKLGMFNSSIKTFMLLDFSHLTEVERSITIRAPRLYEKWMMDKTMAQATYNDILNIIVLHDENFVDEGYEKRVKSFYDLAGQKRYSFISNAATIFHEMSHADYDVNVEETPGPWRDFFKNELTPWLARNISYSKAKDLNHELFGYTAGDSLFGLQSEISDLLFAHGYNYIDNKCFGEKYLQKLYERMGRPSVIHFRESEKDISYASKFVPRYIYVRGKDFDLDKAKMPAAMKETLYEYFVETYSFPRTKNDLIQKLNDSHYLPKIQKCFEGLLN
ncbi:hypothetical protein M899_2267 [Bacteriovorax sp. BSW11_IV]|uniref:hypothetical protein n=1 Tax=Bacteriovorax sp. BSW11_IV TaxID=1353529 RepID=UPI00038A325E|nr:hypothetical protein [Bacteriovorax sp. BSW11_IV]EQC46965.1 hypothetical protein M899_2267 [Bacteriovorax sp. BSW11_IV]